MKDLEEYGSHFFSKNQFSHTEFSYKRYSKYTLHLTVTPRPQNEEAISTGQRF